MLSIKNFLSEELSRTIAETKTGKGLIKLLLKIIGVFSLSYLFYLLFKYLLINNNPDFVFNHNVKIGLIFICLVCTSVIGNFIPHNNDTTTNQTINNNTNIKISFDDYLKNLNESISNATKQSGWFIDDSADDSIDDYSKYYQFNKTYGNHTFKYYYDSDGAFATCTVDNVKYIYLAEKWYGEKNQLSQLDTMDEEIKNFHVEY